MSEYKRFISYLYEYRDGAKWKNRGFSRVEIRNGQCKIEVHMKLDPPPYTPAFQVYAFVTRNGFLPGLFLGSARYSKGAVYGMYQLSREPLEGNYSFDQLEGLAVISDTGGIYATTWTDLLFLPDKFHLPEAVAAASVESPEAITPEASRDSVRQTSSDPEPPEDAPGREAPPFSARWQALIDQFETFQPFSDGQIRDCIRLTVKDLPQLHRMGWFIGSNQFLSHGCRLYGHFLLGRFLDDSGNHQGCILGVPGIYDENQRFLAGMFGFPNFKPSCSSPIRNGQSGYWYRFLCH